MTHNPVMAGRDPAIHASRPRWTFCDLCGLSFRTFGPDDLRCTWCCGGLPHPRRAKAC
jgi:hypothetical protein